MPRQNPTPEDIALPGVQGSRPVAGYDVSAWGQGAQALAKSGQILGTDIQKSATDIAEAQTYRARNSALLAQDNALGEAIQLRDKYQPGGEKYTPDPTALTQNYQTDLDAIADKHLSTIQEGPLRDHARARLQIPFAHEIASVGAEARKRQIGDWRSGIMDEADSLINTTGANDDPLHTAKMQQWGQKVQLGLQQGYLSPGEAEQIQRKTARGVIDGEFRARFRSGRDQAAKALGELEMAQAGVVGPTVNAWRAAGLPDHAIAGVLHNIREESGFNPTLRHFDQPRYSVKHPEDPEGAFAHGLYQEGADEWNRYRTWLAGKGEGADWRDPRLQSEFAAWNLKTNYPATFQKMAAAKSPEQAAAIYASEYLKPAAPYLRNRIDRIAQEGVAPLDSYREGEPQTGSPAYDILTPQHRDTLIREGQTILRGYNTDDERQLREAEKARKEASSQEQLKIFGAIHTGSAPVTVQGILDNPTLTPEHKEKLVDLLERKNKTDDKEDRDTKTYGQGFYEGFQDVHRSEGDPKRITDPSELYEGLGTKYTMAGIDKLSKEIEGRRTPEGVAENEMKAQFLKNARGQITGTNEIFHIKDPKGDELYLKWMAEALPAYDKGRKEGKSAAQLLNPDSPDYVGKSVPILARKLEERFGDIIHDPPPAAPAPGMFSRLHDAVFPPKFDPAAAKSLDELKAAVKAGSATREQAIELATQRGWIRANPAPTPPPPTAAPLQVPVSRPDAPLLDHGAHSEWRDGR